MPGISERHASLEMLCTVHSEACNCNADSGTEDTVKVKTIHRLIQPVVTSVDPQFQGHQPVGG